MVLTTLLNMSPTPVPKTDKSTRTTITTKMKINAYSTNPWPDSDRLSILLTSFRFNSNP